MKAAFPDFGDFRERRVIAVCCGATPPQEEEKLAHEVGREIARRGAILVCGGLGGSMAASCKGAKELGGLTIGIIPMYDRKSANPWVDIVIPTGLGHSRNNLVVATADGVIGVGGGWGTLSELAVAIKMGKPVAALSSWDASGPGMGGKGILKVGTPQEAVAVAMGEDPKQLRIGGF